ncbi:sporulation protein YqfC [Paenibacillus contaminans]|jgi:sporulation protein YqfC|uniref:Sporulation protein YqfC n=1 Tax=Paenibacillus contaminans TaxID=450362 RepID=A0A329MPC1_9BACL|nr:sporulation protein YqfC [Paenibacillus contaminans]RAV21759.1 sporulation protein YqfC [Paenibacillus contaminans]
MRRLKKKLGLITAKMFDVPQDVALDLPRITVIGNNQLLIENHRGVIVFSEELLKLRLAKGSMEIRGKQLVIRAIYSEEVYVDGQVSDIKYFD